MNWQYWLKVSIIIISVYLLTFVIRKILGFFIKRQSNKIEVDPTNFSFVKNSISFVIYTAGLVIIFQITPQLKNFTNAIFAGAGILAAIIGFASQKAFSNIIGGIFILIFRPFRVTDIIELGNGSKGVVEEITLRHTIIRNYENRRIIIPNAIISDETIINSDLIDEKVKKFIEIGVSYDSNVALAKDIIRQEAEKHPLVIDNRDEEAKLNNDPIVMVRVILLAEYSVNLRAYVWAKNNDDSFVISCDLNESIKERFDAEGVEIPYPHHSLIVQNKSTD